ncbi:hypothetical protein Tco_0739612 [Tanacetum coccineum]
MPEWSKFVTDVKLARDLHETNYDQLYAYLSQHEAHAHEVRMMRERYPNPLDLVGNYHHTPSYLNIHHSQYNPPLYKHQLSSLGQQMYSPSPQSRPYEAPHHSQQYQTAYQTQISYPTPSVPQNAYHSPLISQQPQAEFPQLDSGLVVLSFLSGDDPIACLNKEMAFM